MRALLGDGADRLSSRNACQRSLKPANRRRGPETPSHHRAPSPGLARRRAAALSTSWCASARRLAALRAYLRDRDDDGSDFLVTSQKGGRLHRSQFFCVFQSIAKSVGLPTDKRHPHVLKHSLASHLVTGNVNLALVKQALDHRAINSTMIYGGTSDLQASEAAAEAMMAMY
jgi:site-specific recombinase XerD